MSEQATGNSGSSDSGCCGCIFFLGLMLMLVFVFSSPCGGGSGSYRGTSTYETLREERDAHRANVEAVREASDSGDLDQAERLVREREAHLRERIGEIQSSSSYSEEEKAQMLRPMEMEYETVNTAVDGLDHASD